MKDPHLEELWKDPKNWRWKVFYYCKEDPRLLVPKRLRWTGWTVNFAHPKAWWFICGIIGAAAATSSLISLLLT
jgi:uncharacterized membrane protein